MKLFTTPTLSNILESCTKNGSRIVWLDWARTYAVLCIVLCHCTGTLSSYHSASCSSDLLHFLRDLVVTVSFTGVPVFLFLSGYLLLSRCRCRSFDDVLDFYRRKEWPLLRCWLLWIGIYFLIGGTFTQDKWLSLARQLLFIEQPPYSHAWYMPMIIGIYLSIPLISLLIEHGGRKLFYLLLVVSSFASFKSSEQSFNMAVSGSDCTPLKLLDVSFTGDGYVTYILLGYLGFLLADKLSKKKLLLLLLLAAGCLLCCGIAFLCYHYHKQGMTIGLAYTDWRRIACTFLLFLGLRCTDAWKSPLVTAVSKGAFAIYLMHFPVRNALEAAGLLFAPKPWVNMLMLFFSTFILTFVLYLVLRRIPFVARYLFLSR